MAQVTFAISTPSTSNVTSYASGSFTPAARDLLVVFVSASGTVATGTMTDSQGLGFTKITSALFATSVGTMYLFVANALAAASAMTVTFDCTGDAGTGAVIQVFRVAGPNKLGSAAVLQSAVQSNIATASTPAPVFGASAKTYNATLGAVANGVNPATMTPPTSWTETAGADDGYATPTTGQESVWRNSGFTGTTVTWGSTVGGAAAGCAIIVEIDCTSDADGASAGTGASSVVGAAMWDSVGASDGVAASSVVGAALWDSVAASAGVGASSVAGVALWDSVGASAGVAALSIVGAALWDSLGAIVGQAVVTGVSSATWASVGASAGVGASSVLGVALWNSVGSSSGVGAISGTSGSVQGTVGTSIGVGTVTGLGVLLATTSWSVNGAGVVTGVSGAIWAVVVNAAGVATVTGIKVTYHYNIDLILGSDPTESNLHYNETASTLVYEHV